MTGSAPRKKHQQRLAISQSHVQTHAIKSETKRITSQATLTSTRKSTVGIHLPQNLAIPATIVATRSTATPKTPHPVITTTGSTLTSEIAAKAETKNTERTKKADTGEREDTTGATSAPANEEKKTPHPLLPLPPATNTDAGMIASPIKNQRNSTNMIAATVPTRSETTTTSEL